MATKTREQRWKEDRDLIVEAEKYWGPIHKAMDARLRALLDGEHYDDSATGITGISEKSKQSARWVGQEAFDVWRHVLATTSQNENTCFARPLDEGGNEALGEIAVATVNAHIEDPMVQFDDVVDDVIGSAAACGLGWAKLCDWDPDAGPYGELTDEAGDPRMFMHDPRAKSIHEKRCTWIAWRGRMTKKKALTQRGWLARVVKNLKADDGYTEEYAKAIETSDRWERYGPVSRQAVDADKGVTLDDEFTYYVIIRRMPGDRKKPIGHTVLSPGERYLQCESCDWKSPTQDDIQQMHDEANGSEEADENSADDESNEVALPERAVGPCPQCGHEGLKRIDSEVLERSVKGYPAFNLSIICPYSGPRELIYDDEPEIAFRTFPVMHLTYYRHPTKPFGASIASLNMENQLCVDFIMDVAIERLMDSRPIWSIPDDGYLDAYRERFEFSEANGNVMFRDPTMTTANGVELLEGTGVPAAWSSIYQFAMNALTAKTGITDFGIGTANSRDIPSSSVAQQIQQQGIPLAHFQKRVQRELGISYGVIFDAERETDSEGKLRRLRGADGEEFVMAYKAADLPNYDFYLADAPKLDALDEAKQKGFLSLMQIAQSTPWALDLYGQLNHIPPSVIRQTKMAMASAQAPPGAPAAPPGGAGQPAPPGAGGAGAQPSPQDMVSSLLASIQGGGAGPQPTPAPTGAQ